MCLSFASSDQDCGGTRPWAMPSTVLGMDTPRSSKSGFCNQPRHEQTKFVHKSMKRDGSCGRVISYILYFLFLCARILGPKSPNLFCLILNMFGNKQVGESPLQVGRLRNEVMQTFDALEQAKIGAKKKIFGEQRRS